ncbi:hypothetical protein [Ferribacterium limneticum]|uniref:hypothetical protein n=1 Tax=Ferribacterium limneticum TaxID=76259 RepID=UPI001CF8989E|nr:hypothetical protein [Ferribacterium limneticum]UCV22855.1 hypothetical protein KI613_20490 [Ferribacterium limneticum]
MKPTQAKHLHTAGAGLFSHAHGINPQTGEKYPENRKNTTTTRFAVRIQAPERFVAIKSALDTIQDRLDPAAVIKVLGIEVALDAYAKKGVTVALEELAGMVSHFLKGINLVSSNHPRIYRLKNETRAIGSHRELIQALVEGFQIGIANGDADRFQHGYLKITDNGQELPEDQCRARLEIRLQSRACPAQSLDDLAGFNFADLSNYFRFRRFDEPQTDFERQIAERQICLGNIIGDGGDLTKINRKKGGTRLNKNGTKASPLNEIARGRLRKLTERWQTPAGRGKAAKSAIIACGNSACLEKSSVVGSQPEFASHQPPETPRQYEENPGSNLGPECISDNTSGNRSLITSSPADLFPTCRPIMVVSDAASHTQPTPVFHDLDDLTTLDYPPLPDPTNDTAEL